MLPLGSIFRKYEISFHCYADNSQIYFPLKKDSTDSLKVLLDCLDDIKPWFALNILNLNEIVLFGPSDPRLFLRVTLALWKSPEFPLQKIWECSLIAVFHLRNK